MKFLTNFVLICSSLFLECYRNNKHYLDTPFLLVFLIILIVEFCNRTEILFYNEFQYWLFLCRDEEEDWIRLQCFSSFFLLPRRLRLKSRFSSSSYLVQWSRTGNVILKMLREKLEESIVRHDVLVWHTDKNK